MTALFNPTITANFAFTHTIPNNGYASTEGYTLTVALRGPATYDFAGEPDGNAYVVEGTITTAGLYQYTVFVTDSYDARTLLDAGRIEVARDPTSVDGDTELRTHAEKVLAAIEAVLEKRATKDQQSYSIGGRNISRIPLSELVALRNQYKQEVAKQRRLVPRRILNSFGPIRR